MQFESNSFISMINHGIVMAAFAPRLGHAHVIGTSTQTSSILALRRMNANGFFTFKLQELLGQTA